MDEETRQAFASLTRLTNDQHERLIDQISALKRDFQNTKGFLIEDALVIGQRMSGVENRLDDLERKRGPNAT